MHNNFPTEDNFHLGCHWTSVTNNNFFHNYSLPQEHTCELLMLVGPNCLQRNPCSCYLKGQIRLLAWDMSRHPVDTHFFKENRCILRMLLYWLLIWADAIAHFGYLVLKSWLKFKALVNLSITGIVRFVHALKKKRKKGKKKKKSERKTLKKGNKIKI